MAERTRTARSATRLPNSPTSRFAIATRLSECFALRLANAPDAQLCDFFGAAADEQGDERLDAAELCNRRFVWRVVGRERP